MSVNKTKEKALLSARDFQRAMNRAKLLELIRTSELISRTDIARRTGMSQASVSGVTAELIKEGLIEEKQSGAYEGGRRPIMLSLNPEGVHVIGVNMTIEQIRVVVINFVAELKMSKVVPLSKSFYGPEEMADLVAQAIQACMWEANLSREQIAGVGVGIPGPVNFASGVVRFLPNYGWEQVSFMEMLEQRINHPVFIDNSSNNLAIAEQWYGNGKGVDNFLVVTIENGVGAGTILNGQLVRGHFGIASEFGHICVDPEGPLCRCGRKGCVEAYSGNYAILRNARELAGSGVWHSSRKNPGAIGFTDVIAELQFGNAQLEEIYQEAGEVLGIGFHNLFKLLNPELIIITGKGVQAGDFLFGPMFKVMERMKEGKFGVAKTPILIKEWDDGDWARGAGTLVLRELYKSPAEQ